MTDAQIAKQAAIDILQRRSKEQVEQLADIDTRLVEYYDDLCQHSGVELGDNNDQHNMWELLCAVRFLRLLRTYPFDKEAVQEVIYDGEGEWLKDEDGFWSHVRGGLKQPGRLEPVVYRWEPFQVFALASMYGAMAYIPTGNFEGERRLLDSERVNDSGEIEDLRRLCTRFILYGPRKINKSGFGAFGICHDFMKADIDAQAICVANSQEQSKILFNKARDLLVQLDPVTGRRYNGKYLSYSATEIKFQTGAWRQASLQAIPAGGKLPDGKFASMCCGDEYGSASYVNGRSDMGQTMAVIESSMGPRREPMTLITTTASLVTAGPFVEMLESTHNLLLQELDYETGKATPTLAEDRQMCLLLEPDEWERDEEYLLTSRTIRKKINPMLGKIVQHSFYDDEVAKSRMDETKKKETLSKLFNIYQSGRVTEWMKSDQVRRLQVEKRVTDCLYRDGWQTFVGLDFSSGDDLFAITYLSVNMTPDTPMRGRFFADTEAWIVESNLSKTPNRVLYEKWIEQGWLRVCPGDVFNPDFAINELIAKSEAGINLVMFGFDPAQSKRPINTIKAWLQTLGMDANTIHAMVVPVSQTFMVFNGLIGELEYMMLSPEPWLEFSNSPLWPWQFQNARIEESSAGLRKVLKSTPSNKVDSIHALVDALHCFDLSEGKS